MQLRAKCKKSEVKMDTKKKITDIAENKQIKLKINT